jgi:hypothetical protein
MRLELEGEELKKARAFVERHEKKHGRSAAAIGGRYTYRITTTSIGQVIQISCGACRKYKDITDYEDW